MASAVGGADAKPDCSAGGGLEKNRGWCGKGRVFHRRWKRNVIVHCVIPDSFRAPLLVSVCISPCVLGRLPFVVI